MKSKTSYKAHGSLSLNKLWAARSLHNQAYYRLRNPPLTESIIPTYHYRSHFKTHLENKLLLYERTRSDETFIANKSGRWPSSAPFRLLLVGAASTRDPGIGFAGRRLRRGLAGGYYVGRPAARQRYNS